MSPVHDASPVPSPYRALVIGSGGSIGAAFVAHLRSDPACEAVESLSRSQDTGFDLNDESSIASHARAREGRGPFHFIVDATGALTIEGRGPEKSLNALNEAALMRAFQVNAIGPALVLRHFAPLLASGPAVYAKLSARVGSIADNHKGGWYGYRASKAAMNMMLQTAALELQRRNPALRVVALQPGTVRSALSQPFTAQTEGLLEPEVSVARMMQVIQALEVRRGAHFVDHQGQEIPW